MTTTITSNGALAASQARQATEKSADVFKTAAQSFTDQFEAVTLPKVDLTWPVSSYFQYLQIAVDFNRNLAMQWAELVTTLSGSVEQQAHQVNGILRDQTDRVADLAVKQAEKTEEAAKEQTEKVEQAAREQAEEIERAKKAEAREAQRVEREEAKKAQQQAREAYDGLTKAELSNELAERNLPKTGNVEDLVERLVSADTK